MAHEGRLWRGMKWDRHRDLDGVLEPGVALDEGKMKDLNYYLDFLKGKDVKKVKQAILEWEHYVKQQPSIKQQEKMRQIKEVLNPTEKTEKIKKSETVKV